MTHRRILALAAFEIIFLLFAKQVLAFYERLL